MDLGWQISPAHCPRSFRLSHGCRSRARGWRSRTQVRPSVPEEACEMVWHREEPKRLHWVIRKTCTLPGLHYNLVVQLLSHVWLFAATWTVGHQASQSFTISWSLLLFVELMIPSNHLILCYPLLLPSVFPSIRVFSSESALCIRWPKYWSISFSLSPSNEYSGLISFRVDWFDLAVQGTLKSLLQHRSSKASILWCSAFFLVQLSHLYMTSGKTTALTIRIFVGKVMFLLFTMLSWFVIAFLPRSKYLLISWLQSPSAVILEPKKMKSAMFG